MEKQATLKHLLRMFYRSPILVAIIPLIPFMKEQIILELCMVIQISLGLGWRLFYRYPVANIVKNLLNFMNITKLISLRLKT